MFSTDAIPVNVLVMSVWAAAYWYFGSKKFAPQNCRLLVKDPPALIIDGWEKVSPKFEIIEEFEDEFLIDIEGYALKYAVIPKDVLHVLKN